VLSCKAAIPVIPVAVGGDVSTGAGSLRIGLVYARGLPDNEDFGELIW
jgi:hypothetical protein